MDPRELTTALHAATEDLAPRPGFTTAIVRGGRRRQARTRIMIATGAAAITGAAATTTYPLWLDDKPGATQPADPRLNQPTKGDLAGDNAFVNDAARAWRDGVRTSWDADRGIFDDLRGRPHVYWAGHTPAGPAAIVTQQAYFHPHGNLSPSDFDRLAVVSGLVARDPADGRLKLVGTAYDSVKDTGPQSYLFGPGDRAVLVVNPGIPVYAAGAPKQSPDGRISRDWQLVPDAGGVAVLQLPDGTGPTMAKILTSERPPAPDEKEFSRLLNPVAASTYLAFSQNPGGTSIGTGENITPPLWRGEQAEVFRSVGRPTGLTDPHRIFMDSLEQAGMLDFGGGGMTNGQWVVTAGLDGGRTAIVSERVVEGMPNNLIAVVLGQDKKAQTIVPGPVVTGTAPLPVRLRLPDAQGWVVADYGATLAYRTGADGHWQDAGRDAALVPDDAVQVRVSRNGSEKVVSLAG